MLIEHVLTKYQLQLKMTPHRQFLSVLLKHLVNDLSRNYKEYVRTTYDIV